MNQAVSIITSKSGTRTRAMLLGSGELGKEVALELARFGIEVVACDSYDGAPAMQIAAHRAVFDMRDNEALTKAIHQFKPDIVIPEIEAIATEVLTKLEAEEGLQVVPSARAVNITMNREHIRKLAAEELKLPTSPFFFASSLSEIEANLDKVGLPCIIKPIMSSSGKGQSMVKRKEDLAAAWEYACTGGRGGKHRVIVEGLVKFDREITLLTVSACDGIHFCAPIGHHQVSGDYHESWQPQPLSDKVLKKSQEIAAKVVKALGGFGIFGVELFICGDEVIFSELSPRPHDTGMVTLISQDLSEFALHVRAILGLPIGEIRQLGPSASAAVLLKGHGSQITYRNLDAALACGKHTALRIFGKPEINGERRMGVALASAGTVDEAVKIACEIRSKIQADIK